MDLFINAFNSLNQDMVKLPRIGRVFVMFFIWAVGAMLISCIMLLWILSVWFIIMSIIINIVWAITCGVAVSAYVDHR